MVLQDKSDIKYYFDARFDEWKVYLYRIGKRTDLSHLIFQKFTKKIYLKIDLEKMNHVIIFLIIKLVF